MESRLPTTAPLWSILIRLLRLFFDGTHPFCYGWIYWGEVYGHLPQTKSSPFEWDSASYLIIEEVRQVLQSDGYFTKLVEYYAEEPNSDPSNLDTRDECVCRISFIAA